MTRVAFISDVHANREALQAVLAQVTSDEIYCLGDLVDYGAEPNEVIAIVKERGVKCLMGNHDFAAVTGDAARFNARAAMSAAWTRGQLTNRSLAFLRTLPGELRPELGQRSYLTHGSPDDRLWEYVDPATHGDLLGHYLTKLGVGAIGLGHTHVPYVWEDDGKVVFNPGSVGQPRDGDWRASFAEATVEGGRLRVEVKRVEYDREAAAAKIRAAGLPGSFADRLVTGS